MHTPPHPGGIVRRQCLEPLELSVTAAAAGLGVTRQALSDLVNEKAAISVEMAIRLSKAFGSSPETWLGLQMAHDLRRAREEADQIKVRRFPAVQTLSVIEFRRNTRRVLDALRRGEHVVLTYHGQPVARLEPVTPRATAVTAHDPLLRIDDLAVDGPGGHLANEDIDRRTYES